MKCMDCGCKITWDNSYGNTQKTSVCYNCLVHRAGSEDIRRLTQAMMDLYLLKNNTKKC